MSAPSYPGSPGSTEGAPIGPRFLAGSSAERLVDAPRPVGRAGVIPPQRRARPDATPAQAAAILKLRGARAVPAAVAAAGADGDYAGLVTRSVAFALDGALINGCAALVAVVVGLAMSILHFPPRPKRSSRASAAWRGSSGGCHYFAFFWSTTGQTPGSRLMSIRVLDGRTRRPIGLLRAATRFGALIIAAIPLFAGYLIMLWDGRRRCLQDRVARTVVVYAPPPRIGDRVLASARRGSGEHRGRVMY